MRRCSGTRLLISALLASMALPASAQDYLDEWGQLDEGDEQSSGRFVDTYTFEAHAGDTIVVRATSSQFDPQIVVRAPGRIRHVNNNENRNSLHALVVAPVPRYATYTVEVSSAEAGETGEYRLKVNIQSTADAAASHANDGGMRLTGRLGDGELSSDSYGDRYLIVGRAGQEVQIDLESDQFDTELALSFPGESMQSNDDAVGTNSRVIATLLRNGFYNLDVESNADGETGAYTLTVHGAEVVRPFADGALDLTPEAPVSGELSASNTYDVFRLATPVAGLYRIEMSSAAVDTRLHVFSHEGISNDSDNDLGLGGTNSRVRLYLDSGSELAVYAATFGEAFGEYTLTVSREPDPNDWSTLPALVAGTPVEGSHGESDQVGNIYGDAYRFEATAGQTVRFALSSEEFDPILSIQGPGDFSVQNDDSPAGETLNSLIEAVLPEAGTYRIVVTGYSTAEQPPRYGRYTLTAD